MINIEKQVQLKPFNTLNLNSVVSDYARIQTVADLPAALAYAKDHHLHVFVLSGGSNMLLPEKINAFALHMNIQGIDVISEDIDSMTLKVGAGEVWHDFVLWTTAHHLFGLQNLALIPGLVGASPVQNIGAYGVEAGDFITSVEVYDRHENVVKQISVENCHFSYRHSVFKEDTTRYIITHVYFKLLNKADLKLDYGDLKTAVGEEKTALNLQTQVINIRKNKLPDPQEFPNVGSFFKNPVISQQHFETLFAKFPHAPHYPQANDQVKVAAGWLIEQAGWKGKQLGNVGMFHKQALVLVNYANADLTQVQATYHAVQQDVYQKFGIVLEPEPVLFNELGCIIAHHLVLE